jgi:hypothetical protein
MNPIDSNAEWIEADGLGGFASGTVSGIRSRRYHAIDVCENEKLNECKADNDQFGCHSTKGMGTNDLSCFPFFPSSELNHEAVEHIYCRRFSAPLHT